jgi:predicted transcriptional regulator
MDLPTLGALEHAVLEFLWEHGTSEAKDVHRALGAQREITLSTIQSTLERLHRKKLLMREKVSHAYRYATVLTRNEFRARAMAEAAGDLRKAERSGVLAAFVDLVAKSDKNALAELARIVERARRDRKHRKSGARS